ncbi:DMT family transporter [Halovulum sp. GXIMD14793]
MHINKSADSGISAPAVSRKAWAMLALTLVIWASFLVVTRAAMTARLGPVEVGLIRFGTGTLCFLPVLLKHGLLPGGTGLKDVILIPGFGGIAFILLLSGGLQIAPVADSGVFAPSMLPLYVALLSAVFLGERFSRLRIAGFAMIVAGALAVGGWAALSEGAEGVWRGHLMFTAAAFSWAIYTVAFRRSGLSAPIAGAMLCAWSAIGLGIIALFTGVDFTGVPAQTLIIQIVFQGFLSGFVAVFTYFYAIQYIGASRTAAFAALVPVMAALGGWALLNEPIGWIKAMGIVVVALGVTLASGAVTGGKRV